MIGNEVGYVFAVEEVPVRLPSGVLGIPLVIASCLTHMLEWGRMKRYMIAKTVMQLDVFREVPNTFLR